MPVTCTFYNFLQKYNNCKNILPNSLEMPPGQFKRFQIITIHFKALQYREVAALSVLLGAMPKIHAVAQESVMLCTLCTLQSCAVPLTANS